MAQPGGVLKRVATLSPLQPLVQRRREDAMGAAGVFWGVTGFFLGLELIMALAVVFTGRKGDNALKHLLCATTVFCCWLLWAIVYAAQLHPLVNPVL